MKPSAIHLVTAQATDYRTFVIKDEANTLRFAGRQWGQPQPQDWIVPELEPTDPEVPDADFVSFCSPSILVATTEAAGAIAFPELELVTVHVGAETRHVLNSRITLRRFRPEGAVVDTGRSGAVLVMTRADFHAGDLPDRPCCFWFHDGKLPRFLLCNEEFRSRIIARGLTGLSFRAVGHAY